jgi:hypothetical protein
MLPGDVGSSCARRKGIGRVTWQNTGKGCQKSSEKDTPQEIKGYRRMPAADLRMALLPVMIGFNWTGFSPTPPIRLPRSPSRPKYLGGKDYLPPGSESVDPCRIDPSQYQSGQYHKKVGGETRMGQAHGA